MLNLPFSKKYQIRNWKKLSHNTTNNVFVFENSPIIFFLYVKWLAFRQIGNRNTGENILWCYECPQASAAVKTSNEAFGPHLALLALERIFLQKISYLMSSTGYHFDFRILASIYMLLQLTFYLPHGTAPFSQMDPGVGRTQRKYCHYIQVLGTRCLSLSVRLQFVR